jgi:hypothetical protein
LKDGLIDHAVPRADAPESWADSDKAARIAIISECIERGVVASLPSPEFCLELFALDLSFGFSFLTWRLAPMTKADEVDVLPVDKAPPLKPVR